MLHVNLLAMNAQLTEIMRLITNLIRTGTVTEVDRENWLCRVKVTHETFVRSACRPQKISAAPPHPKGMQEQLAY